MTPSPDPVLPLDRQAALAERLAGRWPEDVPPWLLDEVILACRAEAGGFALDPPHGPQWWRLAGGKDGPAFSTAALQAAYGEGRSGHRFEEGGTVTALPLKAAGETLGALILRHPGRLNDEDASSLELLASLVSLAYSNHRLNERHGRQIEAALGLYDLYEASVQETQVQERKVDLALDLYDLYHEAQQLAEREALRADEALRQALTDGLTGVWTKAYFIQRLDQEVAESQRYGHPLTLMVLDLDFFKHVNDAYGHQTGDEVLRRTGEILRKSIRTSDLAARFGGEEFALIMPNTEEEGAFILAERIRQRLMLETFAAPGGQPFRVTMSAGVAGYRRRMSAPADLIEEADRALYRAKRAGRNRVCLTAADLPTVELAQTLGHDGPDTLKEIAQALGLAMEAKDPATARHGRRVAELANRMGRAVGLAAEQIETLTLAALLHDMGKLGLPDFLLKAETAPTEADERVSKRHPVIAVALLNSMRGFAHIRDGILFHHERMDGSGYPEGLKGEQIPLAARIISICDAYDSLVHPRGGGEPVPPAAAHEALRRAAGTHFDSMLVERFLELDADD